MSKVRRVWNQTTSGDLCEYITSGSRDWKKYYSDNGALFIRTQDINRDNLDLSDVARVALPKHVEGKRSRLQPGDLLMTITGANVGKVAIVPDDIPEAYVSQSVGLMRLKDKRFGTYIHYYLQGERSGRQHVMNMVYGMGRPVLSLQNLRDIPIPHPDLDEQNEIVAEIEKQFTRLEAGVAGLRRVQANLKRYRAAVLKAACEGKLVPTEAELARQEGRVYETGAQLLERILTERRKKWNGKGKYKEPAAPPAENVPKLPEGWTWASVEEISTKVVDGVHKKPEYVSNGIPFVTVRNLTYGPGISFEKLNYVTRKDHLEFVKRANPERGDILVSKDGTLGVIRVVKTDVEFSIFVSVALVKPVLKQMSSFLETALSSPQVQVQMVPKGSGLQHIHLEDLRVDCVPLPSLAEQQRIVAEVERRLSVVEELEAVVNANLQRATRLRQSILQRAFEGKLSN